MMVTFRSPFLLLVTCILMSWLSAKDYPLKNQYSFATYRDVTVCRTIPGLSKSQLEVCYQQPDTTEIALEGLQQAVQECQYQFRYSRWNCSSLTTKSQNPYTSPVFLKGYKETAFAYAISSAGVALSVARACSSGRLLNCGCDPKSYRTKDKRTAQLSSHFKWGGCSHNVRYGMRFSKMFLDAREKAAGDMHSKINLHNNQVGRLIVKNNMQVKCKCHGMSGTCELKTCWKSVPDFRRVGMALKENYHTAILVDQSNLGNRPRKKQNRAKEFPLTAKESKRSAKKTRPHAKEWTPHKGKYRRRDLARDLLYYQKSPTFCDRLPSIDVPGTIGRECNRTSLAPDSCSSLCCGRGYNLLKRISVERCQCRFIWCCQVECKTCTIEKWISVCN